MQFVAWLQDAIKDNPKARRLPRRDSNCDTFLRRFFIMFKSVLIANRGEIACRIARTAKRWACARSRFIPTPTPTRCTGACATRRISSAARAARKLPAIERLIVSRGESGAECIHPGYGFLSENADFARGLHHAGIVFVGPPAAAIRAMGLKDRAKALMEKAGVPVVPGYHGERQEPKFLKQKADEIGYPVLIKAVGRRRRQRDAPCRQSTPISRRRLKARCARPRRRSASGRVLIEKYVTAPRHIEMQVFADRHGNVVHLSERDCSLQRRHQKVIEEAPAPGMTPALRAHMGAAAVAAAKAVGYVGAGTVEFVADGSGGLGQTASGSSK